MTINHHPSDALLVAYGSGSLNEGLALVVATHLACCTSCRKLAGDIEAIGGTFLEDLPPAELRPDRFVQIMARAQNETILERPASKPNPSGNLGRLPPPLGRYVAELPEARWRWLAPGVRQIDLAQPTQTGGSSRLLRIAPGVTLPHHGHAGTELTLVLEGSFTDEVGRFKAGDLAELGDETRHQPVADTDVDCICLIATEAPLRFSGFVGRLIQPLIGL